MGIVAKQSFFNSINAYLGVGIGAFNTLILFPQVFADDPSFMGQVNTLLAIATIFSTFSHLGVPVSLVTYFPRFSALQQKQFFSLALVLNLGSSILLLFGALAYYHWGDANGQKLAMGLLITLGMGLFEVFASLSQHYRLVIFPQFLKNVYRRIIIVLALAWTYFQGDGGEQFYQILGWGYALQLALVIGYTLPKIPQLGLRFDALDIKDILSYGLYIMLASGSILLVNSLDVIMISRILGAAPVAFYRIAFFIGSVVAVPVSAILVSLRPFIAKAWADANTVEIEKLYRKSAQVQLLITSALFLLIWINVDLALMLLPPKYQDPGAVNVVFFIGLTQVLASATGANGLILTVSNKQRYNFYSGLFLIVFTVISNWIFIPLYGITGAAVASMMAIGSFNFIKYFLVKRFHKISPFGPVFYRTLFFFLGATFLVSLFKYLDMSLVWELILANLSFAVIYGILSKGKLSLK
jgi:O-antigen/teichoic acid export membrane protein